MLKDIAAVKEDSRDTKRWFRDESFGLYLWQTAAGEIVPCNPDEVRNVVLSCIARSSS